MDQNNFCTKSKELFKVRVHMIFHVRMMFERNFLTYLYDDSYPPIEAILLVTRSSPFILLEIN